MTPDPIRLDPFGSFKNGKTSGLATIPQPESGYVIRYLENVKTISSYRLEIVFYGLVAVVRGGFGDAPPIKIFIA